MIVTYHLTASGSGVYIYWLRHARDFCMPMFVTLSSLLFWGKIKHDGSRNDLDRMKHYCSRLITLIVGWSVLLLPFWLYRYIHRFPSEWPYYLVPKLILYGGCRGGYFIMSLLYGNLILFLLHRVSNANWWKIAVFTSVCAISIYYDLAFNGIIPDFLHLRVKYLFLDTDYLCIRFLFYMEASVFLIPRLARAFSSMRLNCERWLWLSILAFVALAAIPDDLVNFIAVAVFVIVTGALLINCRTYSLSEHVVTLRSMSIAIYLLHFAVVFGEDLLLRFTGFSVAGMGVFVEYVS